MLEKMVKSSAGLPITVFLDNARYQRCSRVTQKAKELGIALKFLPSYSPNLNLIERLWKHVKKTCLTNRYHENFHEFQRAINKCIDETFITHKKDILSLLTPNFQIIGNPKILAA
jgi:transposase